MVSNSKLFSLSWEFSRSGPWPEDLFADLRHHAIFFTDYFVVNCSFRLDLFFRVLLFLGLLSASFMPRSQYYRPYYHRQPEMPEVYPLRPILYDPHHWIHTTGPRNDLDLSGDIHEPRYVFLKVLMVNARLHIYISSKPSVTNSCLLLVFWSQK